MSEWVPVLAVFWILWALDAVRLVRGAVFSVIGRAVWRKQGWWRARLRHGRLSLPGLWPTRWRVVSADVPFSFSPAGICNWPVGSAGRPTQTPEVVQAWRWDEVRQVGVSRGWIHVNGAAFCRDTGHLGPAELLALAPLPERERERRIRRRIERWFRPAHLRRKARVLVRRSAVSARLNVATLGIVAALTVYFVGDFSARLPVRFAEALASALPWLLLVVLGLHVTAAVFAWKALRRLKPVAPEKRRTNLFSASLLPPQALRLRSLLAEGFFPPQHPLALAVAFAAPREVSEIAFRVVADVRWPLPPVHRTPVSEDVRDWFGRTLAAAIEVMLKEEGIATDALLAPPLADAVGSCTYCPRCRDQFVAGPSTCPRGIALQPVRARS